MLRHFGFLKTTALGGILFLLPLIVIGALIGQAVPMVMTLAEMLGRVLPHRTIGGVSLLIVLALALVLLVCFGAGVVARLSLGRRLSGWMERNLLLLFPRYAVVRDQMAGNVGGGIISTTLKPVLVKFDDHELVAFESDRSADRVAVYLPGSPDPWSGQFVFVRPEQVTPLSIDFARAVDMCKRLGRDSTTTLEEAMRNPAGAPT